MVILIFVVTKNNPVFNYLGLSIVVGNMETSMRYSFAADFLGFGLFLVTPSPAPPTPGHAPSLNFLSFLLKKRIYLL